MKLIVNSDLLHAVQHMYQRALSKNNKDTVGDDDTSLSLMVYSLQTRQKDLFVVLGHEVEEEKGYIGRHQAEVTIPISQELFTRLTEKNIYADVFPKKLYPLLEAVDRETVALLCIEHMQDQSTEEALKNALSIAPANHRIVHALAKLKHSWGRLGESLHLYTCLMQMRDSSEPGVYFAEYGVLVYELLNKPKVALKYLESYFNHYYAILQSNTFTLEVIDELKSNRFKHCMYTMMACYEALKWIHKYTEMIDKSHDVKKFLTAQHDESNADILFQYDIMAAIVSLEKVIEYLGAGTDPEMDERLVIRNEYKAAFETSLGGKPYDKEERFQAINKFGKSAVLWLNLLEKL